MSETYLPDGLPAPNSARHADRAILGSRARGANCASRSAAAAAPGSGDRSGSATAAIPSTWRGRTWRGKGRIYSYQRPHHPVHPALNGHGPYIAVLVELPHAGNVRMVGNLLGDPRQEVRIGAPVEAVFEHHDGANPPFTLVQWRVV